MNEAAARPLWQADIATLGDLYRGGAATPGKVLQAVLDRLEEVEPRINAFAHVDLDGAREAAAASDLRWRAGAPLGPLDGVVVSIKDNITVKGLPCAWGSALFRDFVPAVEEPAVTRLRDAGAIIIGKTNVSEFTLGRGTVSTAEFGTTRNPWNLALTTGASSGGAAAAVAAGIGTAALGTDGGGSIRRPASHCGLVGFKPSTGRIGRADGLPIILHDCEVIGPLARSVADAAAIFAVIAKPDPRDRLSWGFPEGRALRDIPAGRPLRILRAASFGDPVDAEIADSLEGAAETFRALGHEVSEAEVPFDLALYRRAWPIIMQTGVASTVRSKDWRGRIAPHLEVLAEAGARLTALDYMDALADLRAFQAQMGHFFETFDILLTPSVGALAWAAEDGGPAHERAFTGFANAAGLPAISLPGTPAPNGLPIGLQLVARFGADADLLRLAAAFEAARPWADRRPAL